MNLNLLIVLVAVIASVKWCLVWRRISHDEGSSPVMAFIEVAGYIFLVGLVIRLFN